MDALKRYRLVAIGIGGTLFLFGIIVARLIVSAADRDQAAGLQIAGQIARDAMMRTQLVRMQSAVHKRAAVLLPYCKQDRDSLFRHALLIAPGLSANLTGAAGVAPTPEPNAGVQPQPQPGMVQQAVQAVTGASPKPSPTPNPQLNVNSIGENVAGPFLLVMRSLNALHKDSAVLSASIQSIAQVADKKQDGNDVSFVLTLTSATIDPQTCAQVALDAHGRRAPVLALPLNTARVRTRIRHVAAAMPVRALVAQTTRRRALPLARTGQLLGTVKEHGQ